ncbi:unnamed protein product (mitochondrion) [Plasmodiophora brassicae]|uniref:MalT-like TPR region domain-containing protein n=1 Tax=Plasmodiophora brassicae TaxID=37360 RepID=A0A3P3YE85_PLABS|nr:unnamed protein product [Plasmodiophora brassicae]
MPDDDAIRSRIQSHLDEADSHRAKGRSGKEVACLEAALALQREAFGPDDPETVRASHTLAGRYNAFGLRLIMKGPEYQGIAENIFRKALALTRLARDGPVDTKRAALRATTFSNLSCLYRRSGDQRLALRAISSALKIEKRAAAGGGRLSPVPGTLLNMSAVLSEMGRHRSAIHYAQLALDRLTDQLAKLPPHLDPMPAYVLTAIAYHNVAVEQEHLQRPDIAHTSYARAHEFASLYLAPGHEITNAIALKFDALGSDLKLREPPRAISLDAMASMASENRQVLFNMTVTTDLPHKRIRPPTSTSKRRGPPSAPVRKHPVAKAKPSMLPRVPARASAAPTTSAMVSHSHRLATRTSMDVIRSLFAAPEEAPSTARPYKVPGQAGRALRRVLVDVALEEDNGYWSDGPTISQHGSATPRFQMRALPWTPQPHVRGLKAVAMAPGSPPAPRYTATGRRPATTTTRASRATH